MKAFDIIAFFENSFGHKGWNIFKTVDSISSSEAVTSIESNNISPLLKVRVLKSEFPTEILDISLVNWAVVSTLIKGVKSPAKFKFE